MAVRFEDSTRSRAHHDQIGGPPSRTVQLGHEATDDNVLHPMTIQDLQQS